MIFTPVLSRSADLIVAAGHLAARPNYAPFTEGRIQRNNLLGEQKTGRQL